MESLAVETVAKNGKSLFPNCTPNLNLRFFKIILGYLLIQGHIGRHKCDKRGVCVGNVEITANIHPYSVLLFHETCKD
jgi:hypothetical protein